MTAKDRYNRDLRNMMAREIKRRKVGRYIVLAQTVSIINSMRHAENPFRWQLAAK